MSSACNFEGCTFGETGACALERDPAICDHRIKVVDGNAADEEGPQAGAADGDSAGGPVLGRPAQAATFPHSHTLGRTRFPA